MRVEIERSLGSQHHRVTFIVDDRILREFQALRPITETSASLVRDALCMLSDLYQFEVSSTSGDPVKARVEILDPPPLPPAQ